MSEIVFKENLSYLRKLNNLSQAELGRELGCSRSCINKWESGARTPIVEDAIKVAKYFNISLENLLCDDLSSFTKSLLNSKDELKLIELFRNLTDEQKEKLFNLLQNTILDVDKD